MRAWSIIVKETPEEVIIADVGTTHMSVTNDAEAVVEYMLKNGTIKPGMRLLYYDSTGSLYELKFDEKGFAGFALGPGRRK